VIKVDQIQYKIKKKDNLSRIGEITLKNGKKLETPLNWIGLSVAESVDFQYTAFKTAGINNFLSNVYDLKYQDKKNIREELISKLVNDGLNHKVDSGGFQLLKQELTGKKKFKLTPEIVYKVQKSLKTDIAVILDVPLGTSGDFSIHKRKIDKTMENFQRLLKIYDKENDNFSILPVIHGHNIEILDYAIEKVENIIGESPKALGVGSLVPMVKSVRNSNNTGGKQNFVKILLTLRKKLPNTFIHAFGIGGTMAYLAYLCGIDSLDSNGWIWKASRGVIQLPGISDRFLRKKSHNRPYLLKARRMNGGRIINEIEIFMKCKCPVCIEYCENGNWTEKDWKEKQNDFDQYTNESRLKRAIHNLWLYENELKLIKKAIKEKKIINFIKDRLNNSIYKKLCLNIINKIKSLEIDTFNYI